MKETIPAKTPGGVFVPSGVSNNCWTYSATRYTGEENTWRCKAKYVDFFHQLNKTFLMLKRNCVQIVFHCGNSVRLHFQQGAQWHSRLMDNYLCQWVSGPLTVCWHLPHQYSLYRILTLGKNVTPKSLHFSSQTTGHFWISSLLIIYCSWMTIAEFGLDVNIFKMWISHWGFLFKLYPFSLPLPFPLHLTLLEYLPAWTMLYYSLENKQTSANSISIPDYR